MDLLMYRRIQGDRTWKEEHGRTSMEEKQGDSTRNKTNKRRDGQKKIFRIQA